MVFKTKLDALNCKNVNEETLTRKKEPGKVLSQLSLSNLAQCHMHQVQFSIHKLASPSLLPKNFHPKANYKRKRNMSTSQKRFTVATLQLLL